MDALPVTDVGKPYKLALRADATGRELREALADVGGVRDVRTGVEDGSVVATVALVPSADEAAVKSVLDRYAISWKVVVES